MIDSFANWLSLNEKNYNFVHILVLFIPHRSLNYETTVDKNHGYSEFSFTHSRTEFLPAQPTATGLTATQQMPWCCQVETLNHFRHTLQVAYLNAVAICHE